MAPVPEHMTVLDNLSRERRKELMGAAVELYKSGGEPSETPVKDHYTRAELRQAARAFGWRGKKAKRQNLERGFAQVRDAVLVDQALTKAKDRVEHPIASRLRRS